MGFFYKRRHLRGMRALVTGASSGIGRSLAINLAKQRVRLVLLARNEERLAEVSEQIHKAGGEAFITAGDVTDHSVRIAALEQCQTEFGGIDLLINNAGVGAYGRFVEVAPDRLRTLMEVNLFAAAELIREATPLLRTGVDPAIVNIGSILGCRGLPFSSEYCASKFALHGLTESIRPELKKIGIDLLLVAPGTTSTEFKTNVVDQQGVPPWTRHGGVPAEYVARKTIQAIERRRRFIIPNTQGKLLVLANHVVPGLVDRMLTRFG